MRIKLDVPLPFSEIEELFHCDFKDSANYVEYVSTDSRTSEKNDLFFSLSKTPSAAISHALEAKEKGCYIAAEEEFSKKGIEESYNSLLKLAGLYKSKLENLKCTVVITGSIGKTTTKDLCAILLSEKYRVHSTLENQNNILGVALTVLSAPRDTEILVIEIGMNHVGEIAPISECISPDIAVITNVTNAHIGNLGSRKAIAEEKLSVNRGMNSDGITIIPHEEILLHSAKNKKTVSLTDPRANFFLFPLELKKERSTFDFYSENTVITAQSISIPGYHILNSCVYALAICSELKLKKRDIENGLSNLSPHILRQKLKTIDKYKIYDDTYSSSPKAAAYMLELLKLFDESRGALLGDMLELGSLSEKEHYDLGRCAYESGLKKLYTFGKFAQLIAKGALDSGMKKENVFVNESIDDPKISADQIAASYDGETILFKASHALRAERIFRYLDNKMQEEI